MLFSEIYVAVALPSSHYLGEVVIQIDSYPAGGLFLTLTHVSPIGEQVGHLWYNLGIMVPISAALPGLPGQSQLLNHLPLVSRQCPPHSTLPPVVHTLYLPVCGLSCTTQLRGQNDLSAN